MEWRKFPHIIIMVISYSIACTCSSSMHLPRFALCCYIHSQRISPQVQVIVWEHTHPEVLFLNMGYMADCWGEPMHSFLPTSTHSLQVSSLTILVAHSFFIVALGSNVTLPYHSNNRWLLISLFLKALPIHLLSVASYWGIFFMLST